MQIQINAFGMKLAQKREEVLQRAAQPVYSRPRQHHVYLAPRNGLQDTGTNEVPVFIGLAI